MRVLGIETSCDETAAAVYDGQAGLLAHELYSQVAAARGATAAWCPSSPRATTSVSCCPCWKKRSSRAVAAQAIDGIAYTSGPGLVGALLVGAAVARSLAYAWDLPCIGVHHMEGHLLAPLLEPEPPQFPFVALLVSGGHTLLARVEGVGRYELLGQFARRRGRRGLRQDGEAARPGLSRRAATGRARRTGPAGRVPLPAPADGASGPRFLRSAA